jgi:hypothetical protein
LDAYLEEEKAHEVNRFWRIFSLALVHHGVSTMEYGLHLGGGCIHLERGRSACGGTHSWEKRCIKQWRGAP